MTYVASPRHSVDNPDRASDCQQCLEAAFVHLAETSKDSSEQQEARLLQSAVDAGWSQDEAKTAIDRIRSNASTQVSEGSSTPPEHTRDPGYVPSSSM